MAEKKTKKAQSKPAPSPKTNGHSESTSTTTAAAITYDPNERRRVLHELQARHGHVDEAHREAFDSLGNAAQRVSLGGRTRAAGVLGDGVSWAVDIDLAFAKYKAAVEACYSRERYSYLLDRLVALDAAIEGHGAQHGGTGEKRLTAEERQDEANALRKKLIGTMEGVAGTRPTERKDLDQAIGTVQNLGQSIVDLVTLGRAWLARNDPKITLLCRSARLTEDLLAAASAAGQALTSSGSVAKLAGRKRTADPPEVNLVEGWVLLEMGEAQRCFDNAHDESSLVPRLIPGPATRSVLGRRKAPPTEASDADAETSAPADQAAAPADQATAPAAPNGK